MKYFVVLSSDKEKRKVQNTRLQELGFKHGVWWANGRNVVNPDNMRGLFLDTEERFFYQSDIIKKAHSDFWKKVTIREFEKILKELEPIVRFALCGYTSLIDEKNKVISFGCQKYTFDEVRIIANFIRRTRTTAVYSAYGTIEADKILEINNYLN